MKYASEENLHIKMYIVLFLTAMQCVMCGMRQSSSGRAASELCQCNHGHQPYRSYRLVMLHAGNVMIEDRKNCQRVTPAVLSFSIL